MRRSAFSLYMLAGLAAVGTSSAFGQSSPISNSITYQGRLQSAGAPANGLYDMQFELFLTPIGPSVFNGPLCVDNVNVVDGYFTVQLAVASDQFFETDAAQFLEIRVRSDTGENCETNTGFETLSPRQEIIPAPLAHRAKLATVAFDAAKLGGQFPQFYRDAANLTGTLNPSLLPPNLVRTDQQPTFVGQVIAQSFVGSGSGLTDLLATNISGTIPNAQTTATASNVPGSIVARDQSGGFSAEFIDATVTNSNQLGGLPRSHYLNATNLVAGTLSNARTTGTPASGAHTLVLRDAAGGFTAGTIVADLSGNATSATTAITATEANNAANFGGQAPSFFLNASNLSAGTIANARTTGVSGNTADALVLRDASGGFAAGAISATSLAGSGSGITALNASNLASGTVPAARLTNVDGSGLTNLDAGDIALGVIANARTSGTSNNNTNTLVLRDGSGNFAAGNITATSFSGGGANLTALNASNLTSGVIANDRTTATTASTPNTIVLRNSSGQIVAEDASRLGGQLPAFYRNASNLSTGLVSLGVLPQSINNTPTTLVLRDGSGNFSAGTITASLAGNATSASTAADATNLGGQPASFYTNASNLNSGTMPNARTSATSTNSPNTIVMRSITGNFSAGAITADSFSGTGTNLTELDASNILFGVLPNARTTATSLNNPNTIVQRDASGNFNTGNITANVVSVISIAGNGSALTNLEAGDITAGNLAAARMPSGGSWSLTTNLNVDGGTLVVDPANARVGIGETAPSSPLHVTAASIAAANNWMVRITNTTGGTGGIRISNDGFLDITNVVQGGTAARLNSTGVWGTFSDRRLKKDIEPALGNLDAAMRLRPVTYAMIKDAPGTPRHLGFIAQEVREVIPEYVMGDEAKGNLAVAYGQMSVVAIGAIQELKADNDRKQQEIDDLKARIAAIEFMSSHGGLSMTQTAGLSAGIGLPLFAFAAIRRRKVAPTAS